MPAQGHRKKTDPGITLPATSAVEPTCEAVGAHRGPVKPCPSCRHLVCNNHMTTGSQCDFCDSAAHDD